MQQKKHTYKQASKKTVHSINQTDSSRGGRGEKTQNDLAIKNLVHHLGFQKLRFFVSNSASAPRKLLVYDTNITIYNKNSIICHLIYKNYKNSVSHLEFK